MSNGRCVCRPGYRQSACGVCQLSCTLNEFPFQGSCAQCPLNTVYSEQTKGCICPSGFYKSSYGICEKLVLQPVDCPDGQYFDETVGCRACSGDCKTCKSADVCSSCVANGYEADSFGKCVPKCGDGLILGDEKCDTGSSYSAGCINCKIQTNWTCSGQPSSCTQTSVTPTPTPTPTPNPPVLGSTLTAVGMPNINSNNVFITLKTNPTFTFANPTEMQSFIKASFPEGPTPTIYCSQRNSPDLDIFDCLLIYPSGVPNSDFDVKFSYDFQNKKASQTVNVNPLTATNSRTRTNSRHNRRV